MSNLFAQPSLDFPAAMSEKYRPHTLDGFIGLERAKRLCSKLAANPFASAYLFIGPPGVGKTTMALALAESANFELHHIPSQQCTLDEINRVRRTCQYVPMTGKRFHIVLVDEADRMSRAAQDALLSILDATNMAPNTIWIFTANSKDALEPRWLSRTHEIEFSSYGIAKDAAALLEHVWDMEAPKDAARPNFARIVKEANNNVRDALNTLETELLCA